MVIKLICVAAVPVVVSLTLFLTNPKFVRQTDDADEDSKARSAKKIFKWTAVISVLAWAIMWLVNYYMNKR
jgi:4-hydroxybenzoate polyprenyltransferase